MLTGGGKYLREYRDRGKEREKEIDTEMTAVFVGTGVQTGDFDTEREREIDTEMPPCS